MTPDDYMDGGDLRRRRLELGLSLRNVALRVGVSEAAVHHWESGRKRLWGRRRRLVDEALALGPYRGLVDGRKPGRQQIHSDEELAELLLAAYQALPASGQRRRRAIDSVRGNRARKERLLPLTDEERTRASSRQARSDRPERPDTAPERADPTDRRD